MGFRSVHGLFETDLDGNILRRLTNAWLRRRRRLFQRRRLTLAFCSNPMVTPDILLMNADGTNVRQLTNCPGFFYARRAVHFADHKWIIFRSDRNKPEWLQILLSSASTAKTKRSSPIRKGSIRDRTGMPPRLIIWAGTDHSDPNARPNYDLAGPLSSRRRKLPLGSPIRVTDFEGADVLPSSRPTANT